MYTIALFPFFPNVGADTLRCLALATVDDPIDPSKMDLEAPEKFADYEVFAFVS